MKNQFPCLHEHLRYLYAWGDYKPEPLNCYTLHPTKEQCSIHIFYSKTANEFFTLVSKNPKRTQKQLIYIMTLGIWLHMLLSRIPQETSFKIETIYVSQLFSREKHEIDNQKFFTELLQSLQDFCSRLLEDYCWTITPYKTNFSAISQHKM